MPQFVKAYYCRMKVFLVAYFDPCWAMFNHLTFLVSVDFLIIRRRTFVCELSQHLINVEKKKKEFSCPHDR